MQRHLQEPGQSAVRRAGCGGRALPNPPLEGPYPYVWLDATFVKVRQDGRVVNMAVVIAIGVNADGQREVLGLDVGPSEDGAFWLAFLRSLVARGLSGVKLVTSDSHQGLKSASPRCCRARAGSAAERTPSGLNRGSRHRWAEGRG